MSRTVSRLWLAPLFLLGFAWPQGGGVDSAHPTATPAAPAGRGEAEPTRVPAKELWAHPGRYLGRAVTIEVQVHSHPESWNPFLTRFGTTEFACVRAWADGQYPWNQNDFAHPAARAFVRRDSAAHWALAEAKRLQRFELTGTVRSVFGGVPWFEVSGVKPLLRKIGEGTVIHASRGIELAGETAWWRARSEFDRALVGGLPESARLELERWIDYCDEQIAQQPEKRVLRRVEVGDDE